MTFILASPGHNSNPSFFSVTKERKPIQTRRHKVKFEDQSDPMSGQTLTYLFWAMANMFFPILTEETRDFSVLAVNILYPGRASSDRSYANPLTVYTHWSGHRSAVSGWCTLFTSGCSLPVLFFTSPLVRGQIRRKQKKRELPDSHLAWRIMSVTK